MLDPGNLGENGASARYHVAKDQGGGFAHVLIQLVVEKTNIALVTLWRLKHARRLNAKVSFDLTELDSAKSTAADFLEIVQSAFDPLFR